MKLNSQSWAWILLGLGGFVLLEMVGWFRFDEDYLLPLTLVALGGLVLARRAGEKP